MLAVRRTLVAVSLCALASLAAATGAYAQTRTALSQVAPGKRTVNAKKAGAASKEKPSGPSTDDPLREQAQQTAERDRLTARIAELKKQIAAGEKSRSGAAATLARAERALTEVTLRLAGLAQRQKAAQDLIATLDRQRTGTEGRIAATEADVARTVIKLAKNRDRDPLQTFLGGGDPEEATRTNVYLRHIARVEASTLAALRATAADVEAQRLHADEEDRALARQAAAERAARETLASDQAAQRQTLAELSRKLAEQRNTASALEADEKRLSRVVEQLQRMIQRRAAEARAKREVARRLAEQQAAAAARKNRSAGREASSNKDKGRAGVPPPSPTAAVEAPRDDAAGAGAFARLRGQLRLPVRGTVTGRFGAPRGGGGATWKGVFVKTEAGADVHAVAAGKVIFADDLRGFGNLLIVDHGDQYLSIYGNNDTLLKHTGDPVQSGDVVSRSGNSSGDEQTGLYFELRFRGRPLDPMPWIGSR